MFRTIPINIMYTLYLFYEGMFEFSYQNIRLNKSIVPNKWAKWGILIWFAIKPLWGMISGFLSTKSCKISMNHRVMLLLRDGCRRSSSCSRRNAATEYRPRKRGLCLLLCIQCCSTCRDSFLNRNHLAWYVCPIKSVAN